jgi:hypothetical protein
MAVSFNPNEFLRALIAAMNIKEKRITSVTIKAAVGFHPRVTIEFYPDPQSAVSVGKILKEYSLYAVDHAEPVPPI